MSAPPLKSTPSESPTLFHAATKSSVNTGTIGLPCHMNLPGKQSLQVKEDSRLRLSLDLPNQSKLADVASQPRDWSRQNTYVQALSCTLSASSSNAFVAAFGVEVEPYHLYRTDAQPHVRAYGFRVK